MTSHFFFKPPCRYLGTRLSFPTLVRPPCLATALFSGKEKRKKPILCSKREGEGEGIYTESCFSKREGGKGGGGRLFCRVAAVPDPSLVRSTLCVGIDGRFKQAILGGRGWLRVGEEKVNFWNFWVGMVLVIKCTKKSFYGSTFFQILSHYW